MTANVLIVESDAALGDSLRRHFEAEGFAARTAENADEATLLIDEDCPDVVLLSWTLTGVSGIERFRQK